MNKMTATENVSRVVIAVLALTLSPLNANSLAGDCTPHWDNAIGQPGMRGIFDIRTDVLAVYNGDLVAGGWFYTAGGQTVNHIARWDGSAWHPFEAGGQIGVNNWVFALTVYNGDLIAGGKFTTAGGQTVNGIARWDGSAWHPFKSGGQVGVGPGSPFVLALTEYDGDLIMGGSFLTAGGQTVHSIARWDGTAWHPFESGGQAGLAGSVYALTVYNGDLIVGGDISGAAGPQTLNNVARWNGSAWHPLTSGGQNGVGGIGVRALTVWNGDLIAGGGFGTAGGQTVNRIARWDGTAWHVLESGGQVGMSGTVHALTVFNGDVIAGGSFWQDGSIARWNGSVWSAVGTGVEHFVRSLTVFDDGSGKGPALYLGGDFTTVGCLPANRIARWGCTEDGPKIGDFDLDGCVTVFDLLELLAAWGECDDCSPDACPADLDGDCTVNVFDLLTLLANWG